MNLIRIAEASDNQHFRPGRMPILETGGARFGVTADLIGQVSRDWKNAIDHQVVPGDESGLCRCGFRCVDRRQEEEETNDKQKA